MVQHRQAGPVQVHDPRRQHRLHRRPPAVKSRASRRALGGPYLKAPGFAGGSVTRAKPRPRVLLLSLRNLSALR